MERDGTVVRNVPRELLRKRRIPTISPHPPPRAVVCDIQELMRLVARWAFSANGISMTEIVTFHNLPLTTYDKNGRYSKGGGKRRQYADSAYRSLIKK